MQKASIAKLSDLSLQAYSSVFILVDENTVKHCYPKVLGLLPQHHIIQIHSGEEYKTLQTCELIWQQLTDANADRKAVLINLGGGVIGDMGGFAAGCYKRGISFINIPTTLLAMVDASVGAKTGIDFKGLKNQIGLFNEPEQVLIDTTFLQTLPQRELASGFAEVLKHYLIADAEAFYAVSSGAKDIEQFNWHDVVPRNIAIKQRIVDADPLENGVRKALNFGHTIGHGVESLMLQDGNQKLLHGEAIAVGMIAESYISAALSLISEEELALITQTILRYYQLPYIAEQQHAEILKLIGNDKKNSGKQNRFSLLKGIGNFSIDNYVEEALIIEALNYYNAKLA